MQDNTAELDERQPNVHGRDNSAVIQASGLASTRKKYFAFLSTRPLATFINWPTSELLFFLGLLAINLLLFFGQGITVIKNSDWEGTSLQFTTLIEVNVAILLLLVTRNSVWAYFFGCTFERSIQFHTIAAFFVR